MAKPILVTGGTGYIASWVIYFLLESGYTVHTTVRDKSNEDKLQHLLDLARRYEGKLKFFEADLVKEGSFEEPMKECGIVIHMASPFIISGLKDPQKQLVEPALLGTKNVLQSANNTATVERVVLTSSVVSVYGDNIDIRETKNGVFTEDYWNTTSSVKHQPYPFSKTLAEQEAWRIAQNQEQWDLVVINPGMVLGPSLAKRTDSTSINLMRSLLNGDFRQGVPDLYFGMVDVRDVAQAHVNAAFKKEAKGRHILVSESKALIEIAEILKKEWGDKYPIPGKTLPHFILYLFGPFQGFSWKYIRKNAGIPIKFDNSYSKKDLDITYREPEETVLDHARQLIKDNLIKKGK